MYGDEIAYIMSDFLYQCSKPLYSSGGDFYTAHFWLGILFVLLYPIGIPTLCGTVIFLHRAAIKDGEAGPSAFKRLYEDYKPDHCLCVATANSTICHIPTTLHACCCSRLHSRLSTLIRTCTPWNRWEIYQLLQKVMLCGLLGFVERGTLTQASLGLVVSETVLLAFMRCAPILSCLFRFCTQCYY